MIVAAVLGTGVGFLIDQMLTAGGRPTFTPHVTLPILLVLLGAVVVVLAIPIRRATRSALATPINPFRALRIAILAKASSIVGAAMTGIALGLVLFIATRPVQPSLGSMATTIATIVCGVVLIAASLVAEHMCTIRKDDDDNADGPDEPPTTISASN
nr:DUF3180 domain-containing protein [Microbacterium endophyticum]